MTSPKDRLTRYLGHLDSIFEREPKYYPIKSILDGAPDVVCMVYQDIPEEGSITGLTYGLSEVHNDKWKKGRPELSLSVDSNDIAWPLAMAHVANTLRGECPFCYGDVIDFGENISDESSMTAFFVFVPSILEKEIFLDIDVGGDLPIHIAGLYPIYDSEREVISDIGLEKFWHHPHFDMYNISRKNVSK